MHLQEKNQWLVNTHVGSICCDKDSKIGLPDLSYVPEQTNPSELVNLAKQFVDVNHINVELYLVEFPL
jgi:hypothetical protein